MFLSKRQFVRWVSPYRWILDESSAPHSNRHVPEANPPFSKPLPSKTHPASSIQCDSSPIRIEDPSERSVSASHLKGRLAARAIRDIFPRFIYGKANNKLWETIPNITIFLGGGGNHHPQMVGLYVVYERLGLPQMSLFGISLVIHLGTGDQSWNCAAMGCQWHIRRSSQGPVARL